MKKMIAIVLALLTLGGSVGLAFPGSSGGTSLSSARR
jgi:hypothetical protein